MPQLTLTGGGFAARFMVARNRPENDEHYLSDDAEWAQPPCNHRPSRLQPTIGAPVLQPATVGEPACNRMCPRWKGRSSMSKRHRFLIIRQPPASALSLSLSLSLSLILTLTLTQALALALALTLRLSLTLNPKP